jgi:hypothetical protein
VEAYLSRIPSPVKTLQRTRVSIRFWETDNQKVAARSIENDMKRNCRKSRNLSQIVARSSHHLLGLIVGADLVSAQIRAGTRPAPTGMANRAKICMFWRIVRWPPQVSPISEALDSFTTASRRIRSPREAGVQSSAVREPRDGRLRYSTADLFLELQYQRAGSSKYLWIPNKM